MSSSDDELKPAGKVDANLCLGLGSWLCCSMGMLVFNKLAIHAFRLPLTLCGLQFLFTVLVMVVGCYSSIKIGSWRDVMRWAMVVPF
eukprot:CAMPEP_0195080684 /NCGR_PEP_ID=MMETSP0448-20130528/22344_1 /TAXON_ID=66468 /ORGANISM="Heterocapsa triquestra, Strain CCMP 448" /LENGTH=86 /DNA_ID=CAMNT_0040113653 /DNA_START=18 /DNA_END=275 /DNA_ORIENTATION=+